MEVAYMEVKIMPTGIYKRTKPPWNKEKKCPQLTGKNNPMYGKKRPDLAEYNRTHTRKGKEHPNYGKHWKLSTNIRTKMSLSHLDKKKPQQSKRMKGENNPNWKGGITPKTIKRLTNNPIWDKLRKQVYKRDNHTCQICGKIKCIVIAHHIVPYRISQDDGLVNLLTICPSCHPKVEFTSGRQYGER